MGPISFHFFTFRLTFLRVYLNRHFWKCYTNGSHPQNCYYAVFNSSNNPFKKQRKNLVICKSTGGKQERKVDKEFLKCYQRHSHTFWRSKLVPICYCIPSLHFTKYYCLSYPPNIILFPIIGTYAPGWGDGRVSPLLFPFFNVSHPFFFKGRLLWPSLLVSFVNRQSGW